MKVYCLEDFKSEFEKLKFKRAYSSLEQDTIDYFFNKELNDLKSGTRLNNSNDMPFIKKRINGRGGFRFYYLIFKDNAVYLLFFHPKAGPSGASNITDESKTHLYKKVLECIESKDLYELTLNDTKDTIEFKKLEVKESISK